MLSIVISRKCRAADVIVWKEENYTYPPLLRSFDSILIILIIITNIKPKFHMGWLGGREEGEGTRENKSFLTGC